ncbi:MAG TPA: hypothetical protein VFQ38_04690 [Longimicrobiales bacterium]|nr:hypothetical protein [Longimicrobiales bacterium]
MPEPDGLRPCSAPDPDGVRGALFVAEGPEMLGLRYELGMRISEAMPLAERGSPSGPSGVPLSSPSGPPHGTAGTTETDETNRLQRLVAAFEDLARVTSELRVDSLPAGPVGAVTGQPRRSFRVRLGSAGDGARVSMYVRARRADLEARSGSETAREGRGMIRDQLTIDLGHDYRWNDTRFPDAVALAATLLRHMRRRLEVVTDVRP